MEGSRYVSATLNYTNDNKRPLDYYFYEPDPNKELNPPGTDTKEVRIWDGWERAASFAVDREGFEIHPFDPSFVAFSDDEKLRQVFFAQVRDFVKQHTGARRVEIFDHTIRSRLPADLKVQTDLQRPAVLLVHSDYTERSAPQRVHDIVGSDAEEILKGRVAFYNVWKPLYARVEELPLAMCDVTSSGPDDFLTMDLKYRDRTGEIYVVRHAPQHRWFYFPGMLPSQALLLKTYDSETDGRARFMAHTAFEDPESPPNPLPRESIEVRTMAFF